MRDIHSIGQAFKIVSGGTAKGDYQEDIIHPKFKGYSDNSSQESSKRDLWT